MMKSVLLTTVLIVQTALAQTPNRTQADNAAKKGMQDFQQLVTASPGGNFGLESTDDVQKAELQAPLPVYLIRLDQLANYTAAKDPKDLLVDMHSFVYPISVAGKLKSSMQVDQSSDGEWKMVAVGRPKFIKSVVASVDQAGPGAAASGNKLVEIPGLNMYFVAWSSNNDLTLTPVTDSAALDLKAGTKLPAKEVLSRLSKNAKAAIDDPPR